eukprot:TRINITY_DN87256_c0_g1_i1.p1 TRINITY_DN87256_c0_g1~~TRINITY_DN87256_c0_g1_i1.p1  ORF type:complete len:349 (+),score=45.00 TRINITY_DN87256_c0_g1_i1:176-1222(+)
MASSSDPMLGQAPTNVCEPLICGTLTLQQRMGVGTNKWGTDPQKFSHNDIRAAFEASLAAGITLLNTAQVYGTSEDCIGILRRDVPGGESALLVSKFNALSTGVGGLIPSLRDTLRKCGVSTLDGFLVHFPSGDPKLLAEKLAEAYHEGLVRNVGVSNYGPEKLREMHELLKARNVPLVFNEIEFSILRRLPESNGLLRTCRQLGVTVLAWAPLASGRLTSKPSVSQLSEATTVAALQELRAVAKDRGKTPAQVAINWCICKGTVPIPGARTREQAEENAGALGWRLTDEELARLDAVAVDHCGMYGSPEAIYTFMGFWPPRFLRPLVSAVLSCILGCAKRLLPLQER